MSNNKTINIIKLTKIDFKSMIFNNMGEKVIVYFSL